MISRLNKRGSLTDPIVGGVILISVVFVIFIMVTFWTAFSAQMSTVSGGEEFNSTISVALTSLTETYTWFDWGVPALVIGLMLVSLVTAFLSGASFIFAVVSLLSWAITLLMSWVFNEIFTNYAVFFPTVATSYPIINLIMTNLSLLLLIWVALISFVMFSQNKQSKTNDVNSEMAKYYG